METLRRVAVWVAGLYWVCCLAAHVAVAVQPGPLPGYSFAYWFVLTIVVAGVVLNLFHLPGRGENGPPPRWYSMAIGVFALGCGLWPMIVGSGVPNTNVFRSLFEDTGVPSGPPGDRELHSHGRRVRALTEEEYQRAQAWVAVIQSGMMAGFAGVTFAAALSFQHARRAANDAPPSTPAATPVPGTS